MHPSLVFFTVLTITTSAFASPSAEVALGRRQLELEEPRDLLDETSQAPYYRYAAFSQVTAGGHDGGDVGAGAAVAVSGLGCDLLAGNAHGRLRPDSDRQKASGEATYSLCLSKVGITAFFEGVRRVGILPSIGERRSLWNRRYASAYDRMGVAFGEVWKKGSPSRHAIIPLTIGHGTTTQHDDFETRTIKELDLDIALYRYRHLRGLSVETLVLTVEAMKAGVDNSGAVASAFMPIRVRYETPDFYVGARAGWGMAGGQFTASGSTEVDGEEVSSWSDTIDSDGLPEMTRAVGTLEFGMARDRLTAGVSISNGFYPTFDGNLARESRVSARLAYEFGGTRRFQLAMTPFATSTHTWTRDHTNSHELAAGTSVHLGHELTNQLRIEAIGAVGVSPYTRLDGERLAASRLGGQMMVAFTGRVTR